jgi:hypothetical protein
MVETERMHETNLAALSYLRAAQLKQAGEGTLRDFMISLIHLENEIVILKSLFKDTDLNKEV